MAQFTMTLEVPPEELGDHENIQSAMKNPDVLRSLCRKEVERFERYCNAVDPNFTDGRGFVKIEARILEGYIYQKVKGHIDAYHKKNMLPNQERNDG